MELYKQLQYELQNSSTKYINDLFSDGGLRVIDMNKKYLIVCGLTSTKKLISVSDKVVNHIYRKYIIPLALPEYAIHINHARFKFNRCVNKQG